MFLNGSSGYKADGTQFAYGQFLILASHPDPQTPEDGRDLRAVVRKVRFEQLGQWMMGRTTLLGIEIGLSGAYGADGLWCDLNSKLKDLPRALDLWSRMHQVPPKLAELKLTDTQGWNGPGQEGPPMLQWAQENLQHLRKLHTRLAKSWYVEYWPKPPAKRLIGDVEYSRSNRWASKADAENYLRIVRENHIGDLGTIEVGGQIMESRLAPQHKPVAVPR